jgi:glycosyltransferase involved in cell wall biosynthesis
MFVYHAFEVDSRVEREARALVEAGYEVEVFALASEQLAEQESRDGYTIHRVPAEGPAARVLGRIHDTGIPPLATLAFRGRALTRMRKWGRRAARAAAREPAALLVGHDLDGFLAGIRAKRRLGAPLVYDSHELYPDYAARDRPAYELRGWIRYESRLIRHADLVIAVTPSRADVMAQRYGIPTPSVIRNMPETARPPTEPMASLREGLPEGSRVVFYSGSMQVARGLEQLIPALAQLPDAVLVVMGSGDDDYVVHLKAIAADVGVEDRMVMRPPVRPHEVVAASADADVGVVLNRNVSLNNWLSLPNKIYEYLAAGMPVVTSNSPEMTQLVSEYDVGETCDPESPADIARAISAVLGDRERYDRLRENARRAAPELTWEREAERYLEAVRELTTPSTSSPSRSAITGYE